MSQGIAASAIANNAYWLFAGEIVETVSQFCSTGVEITARFTAELHVTQLLNAEFDASPALSGAMAAGITLDATALSSLSLGGLPRLYDCTR